MILDVAGPLPSLMIHVIPSTFISHEIGQIFFERAVHVFGISIPWFPNQRLAQYSQVSFKAPSEKQKSDCQKQCQN